jgi:hypothetical protein
MLMQPLDQLTDAMANNPRLEEYREMERFASILGPMIVREPPDRAVPAERVELALSNVGGASS